MKILAAEPILAVRDVARSIAYYRDTLGFDRAWTYLNPPVHGGISLGDFQVMFSRDADRAGRCAGAELFFRIDDVAAMLERHRAAGADVVSPLHNKPWGMSEYAVRDPDGYVLRFSSDRVHAKPADATATMPDRYRVEVRTPSVAEFARLKDSVAWPRGGDASFLADVLAKSTFCVVATDATCDEAVGVLRVVGAGRQFTIWDVVVRPADQNRRVGDALMRVALDHLRTLAPAGSFVGLFSTKPAFYERFGFARGGGLHRSLRIFRSLGPPPNADRIAGMLLPRGQIFYDASCGLCTRAYVRFGPMTERCGFTWVPLQDARVRDFLGLEGDELPPELKLLTRKGRLLGGIDAVACVCKYVWWARPIWLLNRLPIAHELMSVCYRWIARHRRQISGACGLDPKQPPVQRAA